MKMRRASVKIATTHNYCWRSRMRAQDYGASSNWVVPLLIRQKLSSRVCTLWVTEENRFLLGNKWIIIPILLKRLSFAQCISRAYLFYLSKRYPGSAISFSILASKSEVPLANRFDFQVYNCFLSPASPPVLRTLHTTPPTCQVTCRCMPFVLRLKTTVQCETVFRKICVMNFVIDQPITDKR